MNPARSLDVGGVLDTGWYRDRIGKVDVVLVHGRMSDASFEHFVDEARRSIDECSDDDQLGMLMEVLQPVLMDSRWRKRMAAMLKERADKLRRTRPAYVMVTPSLVVRSALTVIHWAAPPPYPHTVVSSLEEGFEFMARHMPGLGAQELQREYELKRAAVLAAQERR